METFKSQRKLVCLNVRKNKKYVKMNRNKDLKGNKYPLESIFLKKGSISNPTILKTQLIFNIRKSDVVYWTLNMNMLYYFFS